MQDKLLQKRRFCTLDEQVILDRAVCTAGLAMSPELTSEFFRDLSCGLLDGDLSPVLRAIRAPLVMYAPDAVIALEREESVRLFLRNYRRALLARGAKSAVVQVPEAIRDRFGMESYLVTHTFLEDDGSPIGEEQLRYFVRRIEGAPRIEMVEQVTQFVSMDCGEGGSRSDR